VTTLAVKDIGFCAHFSSQGDWAFELALSLARRLGHRLNIFHFPHLDSSVSNLPAGRLDDDELIALDRRVREYYDDKLGDFVEAGFRVCEDFVDTELRRCLRIVSTVPSCLSDQTGRTNSTSIRRQRS